MERFVKMWVETHEELRFEDIVDPRPCNEDDLWREVKKIKGIDRFDYPHIDGKEGLPFLPVIVDDDLLVVTPEQNEVLEVIRAIYGDCIITRAWPEGWDYTLKEHCLKVLVLEEDKNFSPYRKGGHTLEVNLEEYGIMEHGANMYRTLRYMLDEWPEIQEELKVKGDFSFTWDGVPHSVKEVLERGDTYVEPPIDRGSLIKFIKMPKGELMKIWEKRGLEPGEVEALRAALRQKGVICRGC